MLHAGLAITGDVLFFAGGYLASRASELAEGAFNAYVVNRTLGLRGAAFLALKTRSRDLAAARMLGEASEVGHAIHFGLAPFGLRHPLLAGLSVFPVAGSLVAGYEVYECFRGS